VAQRELIEKKLSKKKDQQLQSLKSLNQQVKNLLASNSERIKYNKRKNTLRKLTARKRLGRGKYEEYDEPILLAGELTNSLRGLKPQGNIFQERLNSLQRRNILPIAGKNITSNLKKKLREKHVEKRSVKGVTANSRVI